MSVMIITHNLGIVAEIANRVLVMYAGKIVEAADTHSLFECPAHPYTQGLMGSVPKVNDNKERLYTIPGSVPNIASLPSGCRFHPRCTYAMRVCQQIEPDLAPIGGGRWVSCHLRTASPGSMTA